MTTQRAMWRVSEMRRAVASILYHRYCDEWPVGHSERPTFARWLASRRASAGELEESVPSGSVWQAWIAQD